MMYEQNQNLASIITNGAFDLSAYSFFFLLASSLKSIVPILSKLTPKSDSYPWNSKGHKFFSTKAAYEIVSGHNDLKDLHYSWIWKLDMLNKIIFLLWTIARNRFPTKYMLSKRRICSSDNCPICEIECENLEYIFFRCSYSRSIWAKTNVVHNYSQDLDKDDTMFN